MKSHDLYAMKTSSCTHLNQTQIQSFNENGFLILDLGFDPAVVDQALKDMTPKYAVNKNNR
jgi:hypothetical protein